jgi:hypothetical protein
LRDSNLISLESRTAAPVIRSKTGSKTAHKKEHESEAMLLPVDDCLQNMKPGDKSDVTEKKISHRISDHCQMIDARVGENLMNSVLFEA